MFKINEEDLQKVINVLGDVPAKFSMEVLQILLNLEKMEDDKED